MPLLDNGARAELRRGRASPTRPDDLPSTPTTCCAAARACGARRCTASTAAIERPRAELLRSWPIGGSRRRATSSRCSRRRSCYGSALDAPPRTTARRRVVVLGRKLSEKLFGDDESASASASASTGTDLRIVGVLDTWKPMPRFYRPHQRHRRHTSAARTMSSCRSRPRSRHRARQQRQHELQRRRSREPGYAGLARVRVHLDPVLGRGRPTADAAALQDYLGDYVDRAAEARPLPAPDQRALCERDGVAGVTRSVVSADASLPIWLAFGFLLRVPGQHGRPAAGEVLGARRRRSACAARSARRKGAIFRQFLIEAGVVGLAGGLLGLVLSARRPVR